MFYPYCTIGEFTEVCNSPLDEKGETTVHIETPDEKIGFKTYECVLPSYRRVKCIGFDENEQQTLLDFCRRNAALILESAKRGGLDRAYDI